LIPLPTREKKKKVSDCQPRTATCVRGSSSGKKGVRLSAESESYGTKGLAMVLAPPAFIDPKKGKVVNKLQTAVMDLVC
jgi:hypothetical protein